jgi:UDP-N-acetylmuramoyl-tripeptide--D-alanyl-D-alanine ligase
MMFTLQKIFEQKPFAFAYTGKPVRPQQTVAGVSTDSRTIRSGEIYFALAGDNHDGHAFIEEAFNKGALTAVVHNEWWQDNKDSRAAVFVVTNTLQALQELAGWYRRLFSLPVLALTGTNGKTTTKEMIAAVLSATKSVCKTQGNLNNHIGVPLTLFELRESHDVAIIEQGMNHFGEIARLCEIARPDFGLITNIGSGHVEFLGGREGVAKAKMELFEYLKPDGFAFINYDDPLIVKYSPEFRNKISYSLTNEADIRGRSLGVDATGYPSLEVEGTRIKINIIGAHNLLNALAAAAVGLQFGISIKQIKEALENLTPPAQRLELLFCKKITIVNDAYNANPDSTIVALETVRAIETDGRRIAILGDMLELGEQAGQEHAHIGTVLSEYKIDALYTFGSLTAETTRTAQQLGTVKFAGHYEDKDSLVRDVVEKISSGDVILVKGSRAMKMEEIIAKILQLINHRN